MSFRDYVINENEIVTYKRDKKKLAVNLFVLFMALFFLIFTSINLRNVLFVKQILFDTGDLYIMFIISCVLFFFSILLLMTSFNKMAISSSHIIISRNEFGTVYAIPKSFIFAKQVVVNKSKGTRGYRIDFYLKNGKKVNTGVIYCKRDDFETIYNLFDFCEIYDVNESLDEIPDATDGQTIKEKNFIPQIIMFVPLIIALITSIMLIANFNKNFGKQTSFHFTGTIVSKSRDYERYKGIVYSFRFKEKSGNIRKVPVGKKIFNAFEENEETEIEGIVGSMGIVYDVYYTKYEK